MVLPGRDLVTEICPRLLTVQEVQAALGGCGRTYVFDLLRQRELPRVKLAGNTFVPEAAVLAWRERQIGAAMAGWEMERLQRALPAAIGADGRTP